MPGSALFEQSEVVGFIAGKRTKPAWACWCLCKALHFGAAFCSYSVFDRFLRRRANATVRNRAHGRVARVGAGHAAMSIKSGLGSGTSNPATAVSTVDRIRLPSGEVETGPDDLGLVGWHALKSVGRVGWGIGVRVSGQPPYAVHFNQGG